MTVPNGSPQSEIVAFRGVLDEFRSRSVVAMSDVSKAILALEQRLRDSSKAIENELSTLHRGVASLAARIESLEADRDQGTLPTRTQVPHAIRYASPLLPKNERSSA